MLYNFSRRVLWSSAAAIALIQPALAQEATSADKNEANAPAVPSGSRGQQLEEIVVTAQKRSENLQNVPIAVTAITSTALASSGIRDVSDLGVSVPSLNIIRNTTSTIFYLRGVGTAQGSPGLDSTIATFIDGVYIPSMSGSTLALNNIERVEVLKGPQGTLYGRNATGGAVNIITRTPSHDTSIQASIGYGNYETVDADFYGTTGLTDAVAVDLAATYHDQNKGFGVNIASGKEVNWSREVALRSKMLIDFSDDTRLTLSGDYSQTKGDWGDAYRPIPSSTLLDGQIGYSGRFYDINSDAEPYMNIQQYGFSGKLEHDFGDFKLVSITAYRHNDVFQDIDVDGTPLTLFQAPLHHTDKQFTEELQLSYSSEKLQAILGVFYLDSSTSFDPFVIRGAGVAPLDRLVVNATQDTESIAVFGQATYEILPDTNLTLGARYTRDKRKMTATQEGDIGGTLFPLAPPIDESKSFSKPTWRIALDHKLSGDVMIYGSFSRGFKSGVYNLSDVNSPVVEPETLDAYELGFKSTLFDRRARFNVAAFYYDYSNIQLNLVRGASSILFNAASSEIYGIDVDFEVAMAENLSIQGGGAWTHHRYKSFENGPITAPDPINGGNITTAGDLSGNRMIMTPDWTLNVAANYKVPLASGELATNVSYAYNDGFFWQPDERVRQDSYHIVNTQVKWTAPGGNYNIRVWARNLLNEKYYAIVNENATGDIGNPAPGRTYGVSVGVDF